MNETNQIEGLEIEYSRGDASLARLERATATLSEALQKDAKVRAQVVAHGGQELLDALDAGAVMVEPGSEERFGGETVIIILLVRHGARVAEHVLTTLWDEVALPLLKRAAGTDGLGEERERRAKR